MRHKFAGVLAAISLCCLGVPAFAADLVSLTPLNYDEYVPDGKEVDAIYGDYALRNDHIVVVVADPIPGRDANMMVRNSGGNIIDLTTRRLQSDQIWTYYAGAARLNYAFESIAVDGEIKSTPDRYAVSVRGKTVRLTVVSAATEKYPATRVHYSLTDDAPYIIIESEFTNTAQQPLTVSLIDSIRADRSGDKNAVEKAANGTADRFWLQDPWFGQAYVVVADEGQIGANTGQDGRAPSVLTFHADTSGEKVLAPGESFRMTRYVVPGVTLFEAQATANTLKGVPQKNIAIRVTDTKGHAVSGADVQLTHGETNLGICPTRSDGTLSFGLPEGAGYTAKVSALGYGETEIVLDPATAGDYAVQLLAAGRVIADIRDDRGSRVPCKIQFYGRNGLRDPYFGPDSMIYGIHNALYTPDGRAEQALPPGSYDVVVSYGPEYDAIFTTVDITQGGVSRLEGTLKRVVDTKGWISADYHSHSTPSGDNAASQRGRVLNLLAEHVEFAPCTEHQRIDSYIDHLRFFGATERMFTCTGMELTSSPGDLNHQNAFPLEWKPRTQGGGAPLTDLDPEIQIERLKRWDNGADKIVQQNHPDMVHMFFDRDNNGNRDGGYSRMASFMDCIEIHPPQAIFWAPFTDKRAPGAAADRVLRNNMSTWLQMYNMGIGVPGVVNTDAHYNFHGSGWLRNYVAATSDDPAALRVPDLVAATRAGRVIMTNGPFLEAEVVSDAPGDQSRGQAGDTVMAAGGTAKLHIRVQCANWLDVDRVQVLLNGRYAPELNFTRASHPDYFRDGVVKFEAEVPLALKEDSHVVVATTGENSTLGLVYGPGRGAANPTALNNPIFVDIDGNGFSPNGDTLGHMVVPPAPSAK